MILIPNILAFKENLQNQQRTPELALPVVSYVGDNTSAVLLDFSLNINTDLLALTFDEPVDKLSIVFTGIQFFSTNSSSPLYTPPVARWCVDH